MYYKHQVFCVCVNPLPVQGIFMWIIQTVPCNTHDAPHKQRVKGKDLRLNCLFWNKTKSKYGSKFVLPIVKIDDRLINLHRPICRFRRLRIWKCLLPSIKCCIKFWICWTKDFEAEYPSYLSTHQCNANEWPLIIHLMEGGLNNTWWTPNDINSSSNN